MINLNGTILEKHKAAISISNRGLNYGDALFETLRVSGGKIYFWEDHYFRLMASMRILRMEIPMNFTQEYLEKQILATIEANGAITGAYRVKILVWRQEGGFYSPTINEIQFSVACSDLQNPFYLLRQNQYEVELFKDHYITSGLLSTLKTNNKVINVLGSIYAKENQYDNCLLLNSNKSIVEALNGNLFLVKDCIIKTPPLSDGCLKGVMRKQVIEIFKKSPDYEFIEDTIFSRTKLIQQQDLSALAQCQQIITLLLTFVERNPGISRILTGEAIVGEKERLATNVSQMFDKLEAQLKQILREAEMREGLRTQDTPTVTASMIMALAEGRIRQFSRTDFRHPPTQDWASQWSILSPSLMR